MIQTAQHPRRVLVLGATGYVGGRLVPRLIQAGNIVSVAVRSPEKLAVVPWSTEVTIFRVDLDDGDGLAEAMAGVDVVFYLVHSMNSGLLFESRETRSALRVASAAEIAHVNRIIYLGGLHPDSDDLSAHMRSRANVGQVFIDSPVDAFVFQAGIIIGSGSASFEMIRHLATELRWMPAPDWVSNRVEPLAIRDVLYYLVSAVAVAGRVNRSFDIGSGDVLTYAEVMESFSRIAGLKPRHVFKLPLPAPTLSGLWVGLVTPLPFKLTLPLVQSLQEDAVASEHAIDSVIPAPAGGLLTYEQAVQLALGRAAEAEGTIGVNWDAETGDLSQAADSLPNDPHWAGSQLVEDDRTFVFPDLRAEQLWKIVASIGGDQRCGSWPPVSKLRRLQERIFGDGGPNRGVRHPADVREVDPIACWTIVEMEPTSRLLLRAEMEVSGDIWLEFTMTDQAGGCSFRQRATFNPSGLRDRIYWAAVSPLRRNIFDHMAKNIAKAARRFA